MSSFLTFQTDLLSALTAAMTTTTFAPGKPPDSFSAPPSAAIGFVWIEGSEWVEENKLMETVTAMVQVYPVQADRIDEQTPIDPTPLYQAVDDVNAALSPVQAPAGGDPWEFQVTQAAVNHDYQYVTLTLQALRMNQFALA